MFAIERRGAFCRTPRRMPFFSVRVLSFRLLSLFAIFEETLPPALRRRCRHEALLRERGRRDAARRESVKARQIER